MPKAAAAKEKFTLSSGCGGCGKDVRCASIGPHENTSCFKCGNLVHWNCRSKCSHAVLGPRNDSSAGPFYPFVEIAAGKNSMIGQIAPPDCQHFRITQDDDLRTDKGLKAALNAIKTASAAPKATALFSLPCTAGSPWRNLTTRTDSGMVKWQDHYQDFEELIANARRAALFAKKLGVKIVWEWPKPCALWNEDLTEQLVAELGLTKLNIAGCNFGLKAQNPKHVAELIRKQWTLATDDDAVIAHFSGRDCKCSGNHAPCEGRDTKLSEHYTPSLAAAFHQCADPHFSNAKEVSAANSRRGSPESG